LFELREIGDHSGGCEQYYEGLHLPRSYRAIDAGVSAFGRTRQQDTLETFYNGFPGWGWHGWWGPGTATTYVEPTEIGDLTVDVFDANTHQLIWRGTAQKTLSDKPEKNEKKLESAVDDMFKKFPPPAKG